MVPAAFVCITISYYYPTWPPLRVYKTKQMFCAFISPRGRRKEWFLLLLTLLLLLLNSTLSGIFSLRLSRKKILQQLLFPRRVSPDKWQLPPRTDIIYLYRLIRCGKRQTLCFNKREHYPKLFIPPLHFTL